MAQFYNQQNLKIPLDNLLLENGYTLKREKCSKNHRTLTNENNDLIVITRANNEHYLYFNPHDEKDRGNIYSFCKNRGIQLKELLKAKDVSKLNHNINPSSLTQKNLELIAEFNEAPFIQENNHFSKNRLIDTQILKHYPLKHDKMKNILCPTFILETVENINYTGIHQIGYISYLQSPIKKDKEGKAYQKPVKQLCYGTKGLEILKSFQCEKEDIKNIIITESIVDSLSLLELKEYNPNTSLLCSTNGQSSQNQKELLKYFASHFENTPIILGFDNDEAGKRFSKECEELFKGKEYEIVKPILKDFNDDLNAYKLLNLSKDFTLKEIQSKVKTNILNHIHDFLKKEKLLQAPFYQQRAKNAIVLTQILSLLKPKLENYMPMDTIHQSLEKMNAYVKNKQNIKQR